MKNKSEQKEMIKVNTKPLFLFVCYLFSYGLNYVSPKFMLNP